MIRAPEWVDGRAFDTRIEARFLAAFDIILDVDDGRVEPGISTMPTDPQRTAGGNRRGEAAVKREWHEIVLGWGGTVSRRRHAQDVAPRRRFSGHA